VVINISGLSDSPCCEKRNIQQYITYLIEQWSAAVWKTSYEKIRGAVKLIGERPLAGPVCPQLMATGMTTWRQVLTDRNRIIHEIDTASQTVFIHLVCDRQRDLEILLRRRLLEARA
jgi:plasmid stabilization system protein ParE